MKAYRDLKDIQTDLNEGTITCVELVQHYLNNINEKSHLNAFLEVFEQDALERAKLIDEKIRKGEHGRLAGMVLGIKDTICYEGHHVSASSKILEGFTSLYSSSALQNLLDDSIEKAGEFLNLQWVPPMKTQLMVQLRIVLMKHEYPVDLPEDQLLLFRQICASQLWAPILEGPYVNQPHSVG